MISTSFLWESQVIHRIFENEALESIEGSLCHKKVNLCAFPFSLLCNWAQHSPDKSKWQKPSIDGLDRWWTWSSFQLSICKFDTLPYSLLVILIVLLLCKHHCIIISWKNTAKYMINLALQGERWAIYCVHIHYLFTNWMHLKWFLRQI